MPQSPDMAASTTSGLCSVDQPSIPAVMTTIFVHDCANPREPAGQRLYEGGAVVKAFLPFSIRTLTTAG